MKPNRSPRICIVGAGAIGGLLGTRLAAAGGCELSALARGATLQALRQLGWRLQQPDGSLLQCAARAESSAAALGEQDLVILALKAQTLAEVAPSLAPLIGPQTVILPAMNGVPWWFSALCPELGSEPLTSVDPGGHTARSLPVNQVMGCVVHASAAQVEPGLVRHRMGLGLVVGAPQRSGHSASAAAGAALEWLPALLRQAGFEVTESNRIAYEVWYKLWGNLTMNPLAAVTGATADRVLADPQLRAFCSAAMLEAAAVGARIGCAVTQTPEERHAVTQRLGAFKPSMLQDVEAGRPLELDAIVVAVHEMAQRLGVATPHIDALLGVARLFAQERGLYPR